MPNWDDAVTYEVTWGGPTSTKLVPVPGYTLLTPTRKVGARGRVDTSVPAVPPVDSGYVESPCPRYGGGQPAGTRWTNWISLIIRQRFCEGMPRFPMEAFGLSIT